MTVLVTGGAGFIGSHIVQDFLRDGHRVITLDNFDPFYNSTIKRKNVARCQDIGGERFTVMEGSILNEDLVQNCFDEHNIEYVFHHAARPGVRPSLEQPQYYERNNVGGLITLLDAANEHDIERFVNASSSSVYGRPDYLPYDEEHPKCPKSPYGITKLSTEYYCKVYYNIHDLSTVNLRYFTVYGPRMRPNMAISNFASRCFTGKSPVIYGDGEQTRDFTYIDDVVALNRRLLQTDAADGEAVNVGSTNNITINGVAKCIIDETGAAVEPVHHQAKRTDVRHTHADVTKARELLNYEPAFDIREGIPKYITWYEDNQGWYDSPV